MAGVGAGGLISGGSWTFDPFVTVEKADAYAAARSWADWAALSPEQKTVAIIDASTFVRVTYQPPYRVTDAMQQGIEHATIEAARLTLSAPLIGVVEEPQVLAEKIGPISTEYAEQKPGTALSGRLSLVTAMLASLGLQGGSGINFRLSKA